MAVDQYAGKFGVSNQMLAERVFPLEIAAPLTRLLSKPKRIKIAVGGRGSAKSTGIGGIMTMFCDAGERICCTREDRKSVV